MPSWTEDLILKWTCLGGLCVGFGSFGAAVLFESNDLALISFASLFGGGIVGFLWFTKSCVDSLKAYGLGEGAAQLYGEKHAKFMFGEDNKMPRPKDKTGKEEP